MAFYLNHAYWEMNHSVNLQLRQSQTSVGGLGALLKGSSAKDVEGGERVVH